MRSFLVPALILGLALQAFGQTTPPACTGLCLQQVSCAGGKTTTISGTVYAPNGVDPLPNVTVYIPNAPVDAFTGTVSCPVAGQAPSGSPLVGTTTNADGTFTLANVPVGSNIPLVVVSGRWRRQVVVPGTVACTDTPFPVSMPKNKAEGDIPRIAIATGSQDSVECVLRKVGLDVAEFTNPLDPGRIHLYSGSFAPGARVDSTTPSENVLMGNLSVLNQYDAIMLPCEGGQYIRTATQLANLIQYADAGGRVYASHYSYAWMFQNPPFNTVVNWAVNQTPLPNGIATVDTSFSDGQTLSTWLQLVGASTTPGQIPIQTIKHDFNGVVPPTQSWLRLNDASNGNPVMQFTFNTPVGSKTNQCGRVLYNEYHVENPILASQNRAFPTECSPGAMTAQEKLLEYSLFDLTNDGGEPTLTPILADFGSQAVGFATAPKSFVLKNNSTFALAITTLAASGDFTAASPCTSVPAYGSCQINVVFTPTALGARTGTLTVGSAAKTLTASLTGAGVPALVGSITALDFGSADLGVSVSKTITITSGAPGAVALPTFLATGDYTAASTCGASIASLGSCTITVFFKPTVTGPRTGTLTANSTNAAYTGLAVALTGNGVDFTIAFNPTSGSVIAGYDTSTSVTLTPIAGFAGTISMGCTTNASASACSSTTAPTVLSSTVKIGVSITSTSKYTVVGYGGVGGNGLLAFLAIGSGLLLWVRRGATSGLLRNGLLVLLLSGMGLFATGCSGKTPALNGVYTLPGTYTYTITATDGTLTHSATYSLTVTAK